MTLIQKRLGIKAVVTHGKTGQFDVIANGEKISERGGNWFTRLLGAGYPDVDRVMDELERRAGA